MKKIKSLLLFLMFVLFFNAPINAETYKDSKYKFQITPPDLWKTKVYLDGPDRLFDIMSPDENVLVRVRAVQLNDPLPIDLIRQVYEKNYLKGSSLYKQDIAEINGISGNSFSYRWKYNGHDINVVAWISVLPKMAYIISRIIPDQVLSVRMADAENVIQTFKTSLQEIKPAKNNAKPVLSDTIAAQPKPLRKISINPGKSIFEPGQNIMVTFSGLPAKGQDWLAISDINHKSDEYFDLVMLEGKPKSGTHSFSGLPEGNYEIRVYTNWPDGGYHIAAKIPIKVAKAKVIPKPSTPVVTKQQKTVPPSKKTISAPSSDCLKTAGALEECKSSCARTEVEYKNITEDEKKIRVALCQKGCSDSKAAIPRAYVNAQKFEGEDNYCWQLKKAYEKIVDSDPYSIAREQNIHESQRRSYYFGWNRFYRKVAPRGL